MKALIIATSVGRRCGIRWPRCSKAGVLLALKTFVTPAALCDLEIRNGFFGVQAPDDVR